MTLHHLPALAALVGKLRPKEGKLPAPLLTAAEVGAENQESFLFPAQPHPKPAGWPGRPPLLRGSVLSSPHVLPAYLLGTPMEELISGWFAEAKPHIN